MKRKWAWLFLFIGIPLTTNAAIPQQVTEAAFEAKVIAPLGAAELCQYKALKSLGWEIKIETGNRNHISFNESSKACNQDSLDDAHKNGELILNITIAREGENSWKSVAQNFKSLLNSTNYLQTPLDSAASLCAYKQKVRTAALTATTKLDANRRYNFGVGKWAYCDVPWDEWSKIDQSNRYSCVVATLSPTSAMECFYDYYCRSECAAGLQASLLATQMELYRPHFDQAFSTSEVILGYWQDLYQSDNPFFSKTKQEIYSKRIQDEDGTLHASLGAAAFIGLSGYIGNVLGEEYLDSPADRGENFMIVDMSAAANEELKSHGGLPYFTQMNHQLWKLYNEEGSNDYQEKIDKILAGAFYSQVKVYVHPLGIMSFGEHIKRLLERNPRTPYKFRLHDETTNSVLFERYKQHLIKRCQSP
ncbi:MAG: hypothetical protein HQK50_14485 [Oligoflexia bacterium]|nr:hypothetical protein [Oligoflexia bacterium]MBF0366778.1 hypothetical protein [Oligoflexia bacterium]